MHITNKKIIFWVAAIAIVILLALPKLKSSKGDAGNALLGMDVDPGIPVKAHVVKPEKLSDKVLASGTVIANEESDLRSEISGRITQILFKEHSRANKGALLVKISDADLQAQLARTEFRKKLAEDREHRQKVLLEKQAISQEDYDTALNELNVIRSEIQLIKAQIDKTEIRAPFDGIVGLRYVSEGSYISPTTRIATLQNINPVKIDFAVPEKYSRSVQIGQAIAFKIEGDAQDFQGKVYAIEPKIDLATRTLQVRAIAPNNDRKLFPGAFAEVELALQEIDDAIMIPTQALIPELQGQKVFLFKNGKAQSQMVDIGIRTSETVQIIHGVQPGDTVLTTGLLQVRPEVGLRIIELD